MEQNKATEVKKLLEDIVIKGGHLEVEDLNRIMRMADDLGSDMFCYEKLTEDKRR